ncbi:MAG: winged helix-turn-helix transcriptional regulator [Anaerolineales bacterium]|jgi:DNA-binding MarR family transcriptional regulator|nr:winged helix-turn-helix transcriptional regulator [Anaerolineales bacterium]
MTTPNDSSHDLSLLENIERDPDVTQADLATQLGVAVGTINWHLKRLVEKGYVKVKRAERRKLKYIITPEGLALRARLMVDYVEQQFNMYRRIRQKVKDVAVQLRSEGFEQVGLLGEGDVADICRLTCLEQGLEIVSDPSLPIFEVRGLSVALVRPGEKND